VFLLKKFYLFESLWNLQRLAQASGEKNSIFGMFLRLDPDPDTGRAKARRREKIPDMGAKISDFCPDTGTTVLISHLAVLSGVLQKALSSSECPRLTVKLMEAAPDTYLVHCMHRIQLNLPMTRQYGLKGCSRSSFLDTKQTVGN
jgi:hypothetical protein